MSKKYGPVEWPREILEKVYRQGMGKELSDIVDRLSKWHQGRLHEHNSDESAAKLMGEAAAEIERLRAELAIERTSKISTTGWAEIKLLAALRMTMIGGNHIASLLINKLGPNFSSKYPPNADCYAVMEQLPIDEYEVWCCWSAIMRARAAIEKGVRQ